jgi:hypothetical protein
MNYYEIWCNLRDSHKDVEFAQSVSRFLGMLAERKRIAGFRLTRRKFGFGPPELGEFHISIWAESLAQLDEAFGEIAPRAGEVEGLHARVYSAVTDFRAALYRDFPDPQRLAAAGGSPNG